MILNGHSYLNNLAALAADLFKCVDLVALSIKGLTKSVPKTYTFSQFVQLQYSVHFLKVLLKPQFFVHPFLQRHFVVRYDGMVAKFLVGTNSPFSMIHPYFAGSSILLQLSKRFEHNCTK